MQFVVPYAKNRGRCQMMLGRTLRAADNLMQLCIHGGSIKYGDFKEALGQGRLTAGNPMAAAGDAVEQLQEDEGEEEEEETGGGSQHGQAGTVAGKLCGRDWEETRRWAFLAGEGWASAAAAVGDWG